MGGRNRFPIWSADSQRIAFQSDRDGDLGIFWQRADGTDKAERLTRADPGVSKIPESWSPTGDRFLFDAAAGSNVSLWTFSVAEKKAERFGDARSAFPMNAVFAPDGRWVAYSMYAADTTGIFIEPFPSTGAKSRIATSRIHPLWSPDGRELFSLGSSLVAVPIATARGLEFGSPVPIPRSLQHGGMTSVRSYDIMPDGKRFVGLVPSEPDRADATPQIQVVLNWAEELKNLVRPAK